MWNARHSIFRDSLLLTLLAAALVLPLFKLQYLNNWSSIESAFIADGRFLAEHWPHPLWQPLWYGGTRFDYVYPPALRYGTAALVRIFSIAPSHAYHIFTAFLYAIGIVGVYVLVRIGAGSRRAAWLAAAATALVSPSFLLMRMYRYDSEHLVPQRLHVLMKFGEGPHITALALLPFALAAAFVALRGRRPAALVLAAVLSAAVALTNFYGATSLAVFFAILVWTVWVTDLDRRIWLRAAGIVALAYGLTAFWLVPSYVRVTLANLGIVSATGNAWSAWIGLAAVAVFMFLTLKFARGRKEHAWSVFVTGAAAFFSLNVLGGHYFGFQVAGNTARLVPELDLALILLSLEALRFLWRPRPALWPRVVAVVVVLTSCGAARHYLRHAWEIFPPDPAYKDRVEFRITDWVTRELPGARVFATGSIRFWYDAWHDLPQAGGASDQALTNPNLMHATWETTLGPQPEPAILWLKALGVDAIIVPQKASREIYHDFPYPQKFAGALPVLYDDREGNIVYRVPRRYPSLARVVDRASAESLGPVRSNMDVERLAPYVDVIEAGPASPVNMVWEGTDAIRLHATVADGQCVLVQATYDPAWRAYAGGTPVPVHKDALGQMLLYPPAGEQDVRLRFELLLENIVGRWLTALSIAAVLFLLYAARFTSPGNRKDGSVSSM